MQQLRLFFAMALLYISLLSMMHGTTHIMSQTCRVLFQK